MITGTGMITERQNPQSLLRLMTWLSPAFPIGGFSYSHGLEAAVSDGLVTSKEALRDWVASLITSGSIWNDCMLLCEAHRSQSEKARVQCSDYAEALAGSKERHLETMRQGEAFLAAARAWTDEPMTASVALPVALGFVARVNGIDERSTLIAYLQAFVTSQIQAALRLFSLGQANGLWVQRELEETILSAAERAGAATLDELGSNTINAEVAAMNHETMQSRIFRS